MSDDSFDLDSDLDNFDLDLDDGGFDDQVDQPGGRGVVEKVSTSFLKGASDELTDPTKISKRLKKVLPDTYASSFDAADDLTRGMVDIKSIVAKETKEGVKDFKRAANAILESKKDYIPESIANKLGGWFKQEDEYSTPSKGEQETSAIEGELADIFGAQMSAQAAQDAEGSARAQVSEALAGKRHESQVEQLFGIRQALHRQNEYQDNITARYQRKSLELKYRQIYLATDTLKVLGDGLRDLKESSIGILKNTALPEFKKIQLNEVSMELFRDSVLGNVQSGAADFSTNFLKRTGNRIKDRVREKASDIGSQLTDVAGMMEELGGDGLEGVDKVDLAGGLVGGAASEYALNKINPKLEKFLKDNPTVAKYGLKANTLVGDIPRILNEYLQSETESHGIKGLVESFVKDTLQGEGLDSTITTGGIEDSVGSAFFDNATRKSIVEIIPGYLSRIHQEIASVRTGMGFEINPDTKVTYDVFNNKFTTTGRMNVVVGDKLLSRDDIETGNSEIQAIIDKLDPKRELSTTARKVLTRRILEDNFNNVRLDIVKLSDPETYTVGDEDSLEEISSVLQSNFAIEDGKMGSTLEIEQAQNSAKTKFNSLARNIKDPRSQIEAFIQMGLSENADSTGLATRGLDGGYTFNYDALLDRYSGYTGSMGPSDPNIGPNLPNGSGGPSMGPKPSSGPSGGPRDILQDIFRSPSANDSSFGGSKVVNIRDHLESRNDDEYQYGRKVANGSLDAFSTQEIDTGPDSPLSIVTSAVSKAVNEGQETVVTTLTEIRDNLGNDDGVHEYRTTHISILTGILDNISAIASGSVGSGDSKATQSLLGRTKGLLKGALGGYGSYLKGVGKLGTGILSRGTGLGKTVLSFGKSTLSGFKTRVNKLPEISDLFIKGEVTPRIEAWKLKNGKYFDSVTGLPILDLESLSKMKGNLMERVDGVDIEVVSLKDLANGLISRTGLEVKSRATSLLDGAKGLLSRGVGLATAPYRVALDIAKGGFNKSKEFLSRNVDVYVRGSEKPALLKSLMEAGRYFDKATGEVITNIKDIKGDVIDADGNIVLTHDDLLTGLTDAKGRAIDFFNKNLGFLKPLGSKGLALAKQGMNVVANIYKGGFGLVKSGLNKIGNFFNSDGSLNSEELGLSTVSILRDIRDILDNRLPDTKPKVKHDTDGDGFRENSWRDKLYGDKDKTIESGSKSTKESKTLRERFTSLTTLAGFGKGRNKDKGDDEDGGLGLLEAGGLGAGLAALYGAAKAGIGKVLGKGKKKITLGSDTGKSKLKDLLGKGKGLLGRIPTGNLLEKGKGLLSRIPTGNLLERGKGLLGKGVSSLKDLYKSSMGKWGGKAAASGASTVAKNASTVAKAMPWLARGGMVVAGVVSLPVLLWGTLAAGVATGGYYLYKKLSGKLEGFDLLRITQYGFDSDDTDSIARVKYLEATLMPLVKVTGGRVTIDSEKIDLVELIRGVGLDPDNSEQADRFKLWFKHRFIPVFLASAGGLKTLTSHTSLEDVNGKLKDSVKRDYLTWANGVTSFQIDGVPPYEIIRSPWGGNPLLRSSAVMVVSSEILSNIEQTTGVKTVVKNSKLDPKPLSLVSANNRNPVVQFPVKPVTNNQTTDAFITTKNNRLHTGSSFTGGTVALGNLSGHTGSINDLPMPMGDGSWSAHKDLIVGASKMVGVDPGLMATMAAIESGFNSKAKAKTSSASGLYQFINGTWKTMLSRYGKKYGIAPGTSQFDPRANALMGAEFLRENSEKLKRVLKREVTDTDIYLAHFLGAGGAGKFLTSNPNDSAVKAMPSAARANPSIFRNRGVPRTMGEVYQVMDRKVSKFRNRYADSARSALGISTPVKSGLQVVNKPVPIKPDLESKQSVPRTSVMETVMSAPTPTGGTVTEAFSPVDKVKGSTLNKVRMLSASRPTKTTPLMDESLRFKQEAMLNDAKDRMTNAKSSARLSEVAGVLKESLKAQLTMTERLTEIRDILLTPSIETIDNEKPASTSKSNRVKTYNPTPVSASPVTLKRLRNS